MNRLCACFVALSIALGIGSSSVAQTTDHQKTEKQNQKRRDALRDLKNLADAENIGIDGLPINDELMAELKQHLPNTEFEYKTDYGFFD